MSGYNEDAYRQARETVIDLPCPFERALLSRCVACFKSRKLLLAEREAITCSEKAANTQCLAFHQALHHNARFALHTDPSQPWPFGKEIRAQCGGVLGLKEALGHGEGVEADVAELMLEGIGKFGGVEGFPYSAIMRAVVHYEPRRRRDR
jgi:hypothetical protein